MILALTSISLVVAMTSIAFFSIFLSFSTSAWLVKLVIIRCSSSPSYENLSRLLLFEISLMISMCRLYCLIVFVYSGSYLMTSLSSLLLVVIYLSRWNLAALFDAVNFSKSLVISEIASDTCLFLYSPKTLSFS